MVFSLNIFVISCLGILFKGDTEHWKIIIISPFHGKKGSYDLMKGLMYKCQRSQGTVQEWVNPVLGLSKVAGMVCPSSWVSEHVCVFQSPFCVQ